MTQITGGQLVAKMLSNIGVKSIFTLTGVHIIDIYSGCIDEDIRIIDVRHEQAAAHAAEAWTRLTGIPGVAVVTAGPGITDAITGIANAFRNQVPMLVIGGQAPRSQLLKGGLQELDHVSMLKPITKFAASIYDTERIPELISQALKEAYNGRPGPSFLEIPMDVLIASVEQDKIAFPVRILPEGHMHGDPALIQKAAELLDGAKRPVIVAGSQIWHCRGYDELQMLAERNNIPVYLNGAARGCLSNSCCVHFVRSRRYALSKADTVLIIGTPFDFRLAYGKRISQDAKIIQIDLDYSELGRNRSVDVGIQGDAKAVLRQISEAIRLKVRNDEWLAELCKVENELYEKDREFMYSENIPIHPLRLARDIKEFMKEDTVFIADGGDVVTMCANTVIPSLPGRWLDPGPLGTLGVGTPFAIGAKAAMPETEVIVLFGDGAFGLTGFDYDTLIRFNMPIIGIVANNASWNQVRHGQVQFYGEKKGFAANRLTPLRYDKVVEAMGGYGEHVLDPSEILSALNRARESGKPSCINVMVDPDVFSSGTIGQSMFK